MSEHFRAFCKPYLDKLLAWARKDSDVSLAEYEEMQKKYNEMYK